MNAKELVLSFAPWVVFSFLLQRRGVDIAALAAFAAAGVALALVVKDKAAHGVKLVDAASVVTFGVLAAAAGLGGHGVRVDVADYGRGFAALALGAVMLASVTVLPFTEQYARESVPEAYWNSPVFRAVNRKISAAFGLAILVMGGGHLLAGAYDPISAPVADRRPVELVLNWVVPALLVGGATLYARKVVGTREAAAVAVAR
jgi:hypothetical protein